MKCTYLLTQRAGNRINFYISTQYLPNPLQTTIYRENLQDNKQNCVLTAQISSCGIQPWFRKETHKISNGKILGLGVGTIRAGSYISTFIDLYLIYS